MHPTCFHMVASNLQKGEPRDEKVQLVNHLVSGYSGENSLDLTHLSHTFHGDGYEE